VLVVAQFVPQPSEEGGAQIWLVVLWLVGMAATELLFRILRGVVVKVVKPDP